MVRSVLGMEKRPSGTSPSHPVMVKETSRGASSGSVTASLPEEKIR
jgi:hypothetical protein